MFGFQGVSIAMRVLGHTQNYTVQQISAVLLDGITYVNYYKERFRIFKMNT